jgi:glycosyltransferase involved in cell wall biosynthesis
VAITKKKDFKVSVIIPVFKAEKFLVKAVNSAIKLQEVGEVIIIDDKSPDNAFEVCKKLSTYFEKVKFYVHPNNEHRGVSESRNLGIKKAIYDFIAFLDADDWYLANRFKYDVEVFEKYPNADAAYSSSILEANQQNKDLRDGARVDIRKIKGYKISSKAFYKAFLSSQTELFHVNTITFKKSFLIGKKLFDERLTLHQDTELWYRLIRVGNFYASQIDKPVAIIRRHTDNRITSRTIKTRLKMYQVFIENVGVQNLYDFEKRELFKRINRLYSRSLQCDWKRRYFYYRNLFLWSLLKDKYLENFSLGEKGN